MPLLSGWMGHAVSVDVAKLQKEYAPLLVEDEKVEAAFQLVRDTFIFTSYRLILVDKQGMSGRKVETLTIPYSSIVCFSKESAGMMDMDAELKIWVRGEDSPIVKEFKKDNSVDEVYRILGQAVLK
jgi:hypothetical protein